MAIAAQNPYPGDFRNHARHPGAEQRERIHIHIQMVIRLRLSCEERIEVKWPITSVVVFFLIVFSTSHTKHFFSQLLIFNFSSQLFFSTQCQNNAPGKTKKRHDRFGVGNINQAFVYRKNLASI